MAIRINGNANIGAMSSMMNVLQNHGIYYWQTGNCFSENFQEGKFKIDSNDTHLTELSAHSGLGGFYVADECIPDFAARTLNERHIRHSSFDTDGATYSALLPREDVVFWRDSSDILGTDGPNQVVAGRLAALTLQAWVDVRGFGAQRRCGAALSRELVEGGGFHPIFLRRKIQCVGFTIRRGMSY